MVTGTAVTELATQLHTALVRTTRRLRQERTAEISIMQGAALALLERDGPLTPSELASRERVQRPTATRMIARLEELGLVARAADPQDGRCSVIAISDRGRVLLSAERTRRSAFLVLRLRKLSPEDSEILGRAAVLLEGLFDDEPA